MVPPDKIRPLSRSKKHTGLLFRKELSSDWMRTPIRSNRNPITALTLSSRIWLEVCCGDHQYKHAKCKHIIAVEYSFELRHEVESVAVKTVKPMLPELSGDLVDPMEKAA
ncbi:MAG: hypothetical protein ACRD5H_19030 [Nitrososphaerales archaeon]